MAPVGTAFHGLRERVFEANREIVRAGLVILTFGNASAADRATGVMAITLVEPLGVALHFNSTETGYFHTAMRPLSIACERRMSRRAGGLSSS